MRSVVWKRWKRGRKRFAELRARGGNKDLAAQNENRHRQAAKQLLEHVVRRRPRNPASHAQLGSACYLMGQIAEARAAFERGLEADPDNVRLLNDLAWLLSEDRGDPQAAAK